MMLKFVIATLFCIAVCNSAAAQSEDMASLRTEVKASSAQYCGSYGKKCIKSTVRNLMGDLAFTVYSKKKKVASVNQMTENWKFYSPNDCTSDLQATANFNFALSSCTVQGNGMNCKRTMKSGKVTMTDKFANLDNIYYHPIGKSQDAKPVVAGEAYDLMKVEIRQGTSTYLFREWRKEEVYYAVDSAKNAVRDTPLLGNTGCKSSAGTFWTIVLILVILGALGYAVYFLRNSNFIDRSKQKSLIGG